LPDNFASTLKSSSVVVSPLISMPDAEFFGQHWGLLLLIFGIVGSFVGGMAFDWWFQSRRGRLRPSGAGLFF
jgi:uncharacterized membrane protein YeaQ/YmgE (transglycosylase-associated protein family)